MSGVAGLMLVKDERDVIEYSLRHLLRNVDHVYVADNLSKDGTREILARVQADRRDGEGTVEILDDTEVAYLQSEKMTSLALRAHRAGYDWVVPVDADEYWHVEYDQPEDVPRHVGAMLMSLEPETLFVDALLYDHKATMWDDPNEPDPLRRMRWRFRRSAERLRKVACRTSDDLTIHMGNHSAHRRSPGVVSSSGWPPTKSGLLVVEHFAWRSAEQFTSKIRNGYYAYLAAGGRIAPEHGTHWKNWPDPRTPEFEERTRDWFNSWGYTARPDQDSEIVRVPLI